MKRRLLNLLTALSLLVCLAAVGLWVRSYRASDGAGWRNMRWEGELVYRGREYSIRSARGAWTFARLWGELDLSGHERSAAFAASLRPQVPDRRGFYRDSLPPHATGRPLRPGESVRALGFAWERVSDRRPAERSEWRAVKVPAWSVVALAAALPAWRLRAVRRLRRLTRSGNCPRCGYDLRGTPDRCPECGTIAPSRPAG